MHMQLRHHIAEGSNIQLVRFEEPLHRLCQTAGFEQQGGSILCTQVMPLAHTGPARHQNAPRVLRIIHQQQTAKRQLTYRMTILRQSRIQFEIHHPLLLLYAATGSP